MFNSCGLFLFSDLKLNRVKNSITEKGVIPLSNNVVDFSLYQFRNRAQQAAQMWNDLLDLEEDDSDIEFLWLPVEEPANDNLNEFFFETLLNNFLPKTREDYEKFFGKPTDPTKDKIWYDGETGEFDFSDFT